MKREPPTLSPEEFKKLLDAMTQDGADELRATLARMDQLRGGSLPPG